MISEADINASRTAAASPAADVPSSHPTPDIPLPTSPALPRRAVPLTFNPIINDEANILAAISRGDRTIGDLAEEHGTTVSNFCIWLQRDDIQKKLNDLTTCGATLTRVAAVNQLPKAVKSMTFQIEAHIFDRTHNLIKPGLDADRIAALRDANARKACHLLLRLARFDPSRPLYSPRSVRALPSAETFPRGVVPAQPGVEAPALSTSVTPDSSTSLPPPDILSLCAAALSPARTARDSLAPTNTEPKRINRTVEPDSSPSSVFSTLLDSLGSLGDEELQSALHRGEIDTPAIVAAASTPTGPAP